MEGIRKGCYPIFKLLKLRLRNFTRLMREYLLVGFGGMLGSMARYASGSYFLHTFHNSKFPWGTFFVNVVGCLLIGLLAGLTEKLISFNSEIRLLGITGFLGGFTTFSAFSIETLNLLRGGFTFVALLYALGSLVLGVSTAYIGLKIAI